MQGKKTNRSYKALLNKKDPLDKRILTLIKNDEVTVGVVELKR